jgi:hypothetical protein
MIRNLIILIISVLSVFSVSAQKTAKYSNEFLNLGAGARSFGMANSVIASVDDVTSGYWNPAGLTDVKGNMELSFMHAEYFAGIANYDYLGFATHIDENTAVGISAVRFGVDGILNTFNLIQNGQINYDLVTEFSAVDYGIILSFAKKTELRKYRDVNFSYGVNGKIIHRKVGPFAKAWGFGADAGVKLDMPKSGWKLAIMARDITSSFNSWSYTFTEEEEQILTATDNSIPVNSLEITLPRIIFGVSKLMTWDKISLNTEFNFDLTTDGKRNTLIKTGVASIDPHFGLEGGYELNGEDNKLFLRAGIGNIQKETNDDGKEITSMQPSIGVGVQLGQISLDYAFTDVGDASAALYSNVFSLKFNITRNDL